MFSYHVERREYFSADYRLTMQTKVFNIILKVINVQILLVYFTY